jgi:hypothetical protein
VSRRRSSCAGAALAVLLAASGVAAATPAPGGASAPADPADSAPAETPKAHTDKTPAPAKAPAAAPTKAAAEAARAQAAADAKPKRDRCAEFDAASIPACADRLARTGGGPAAAPPPDSRAGAASSASSAPGAAAAPPAHPPSKPALKPAARAAKLRAAGPKAAPATAWTRVKALRSNPILEGAGAGAALLLLSGGVWAVASRLRRRPRPPRPPPPLPATPPTAYRRDVLLRDAAGRDWRIGGRTLSPGAAVGCGPQSDLRLDGEGLAARHVLLWVREGRLMLRKIAEEPVFLNDRLLKDATPEVASTGDTLLLGRAQFTIIID